jgi:hypothetical protein
MSTSCEVVTTTATTATAHGHQDPHRYDKGEAALITGL